MAHTLAMAASVSGAIFVRFLFLSTTLFFKLLDNSYCPFEVHKGQSDTVRSLVMISNGVR